MPQNAAVTRLVLFILFNLLSAGIVYAQNNDSFPTKSDSLKIPMPLHDSAESLVREKKPALASNPNLSNLPKRDTIKIDSTKALQKNDTAWLDIATAWSKEPFIALAFKKNHFFGFSSRVLAITSNKKEFRGKEVLFYTLIAFFLFFAFLRSSFPKYLIDLFRVAFRTTLKQRQLGEQLVQTPLPSLLFNFFFLVSSSFYLDLVLQHYQLAREYNFWVLFLYCFLGLACVYIVKLFTLKFCGWLFNISPITDGYIFIVFMVNKIIGIYLLPFLALLAFTDNDIYTVSFMLSYLGVFALLGYRFILAYGLIQKQMRLNPFHFFLYLCAFEIIPLFLIYKALLLWF